MMKSRIKKKELLWFLVGGGSAVMTDYITYRVLLHIGINMSVSKAVSYASGAVVGFVVNKVWTFECRGFSRMEIMKYAMLYTASACANASINNLVMLGVNMQLFAFLCATGVSTVLNFLGQKFFVFTGKGERI